MHKFRFIFLTFFVVSAFAQQDINLAKTQVDSLFREDQFYVSVSYNLVQNRPTGFKQFGFSQGFTTGFLRDFPVSKNRHWSLAPGFGYSYNNIKQFINSEEIFGDEIPKENIRTTIVFHGIDLPLEIRWRNATPESHKFWRIYTGIKATYLLNATLKFESSFENDKQKILEDVNQWQYGTYIAAGFNTWNAYVYYGINPLFKDGSKQRNLNLGFMFYIL